MKDRIPTYPGRVKLEPVAGQDNIYDMTRADEPEQEGTPLNKASLLTDETAALLALEQEDPTVNDALYTLASGITTGTTIITVLDAEGNPVPGVAINGLTDEAGNTVTTGQNGKATVICTAVTSVTFSSGCADLVDLTQTITPKTPGVNLVMVTMPFEAAGTVKLISASGAVKFYKARTVDLCLVGGGTGGNGGSGGSKASGGSGGSTGKVLHMMGVAVTKDGGTLAVGAGGAGGLGGGSAEYGSAGSGGGDTTFLSYSSASGSTGTLPFDTSGAGSMVGGAGGDGGRGSYSAAGSAGYAGARGGGHGGKGGDGGNSGSTGGNGANGVNGGGGGGGGGGGAYFVGSGTAYLSGGLGGAGGDGCLMVRIL